MEHDDEVARLAQELAEVKEIATQAHAMAAQAAQELLALDKRFKNRMAMQASSHAGLLAHVTGKPIREAQDKVRDDFAKASPDDFLPLMWGLTPDWETKMKGG